jgi:uncharacterized membrane protein
MTRSWLRPILLLLQWYLTGLLAWSLWVPGKLTFLFWEIAKPICRACPQEAVFVLGGLLFGAAVWLLADREGRERQLRLAGWLVFLLGCSLLLPSILRFPRPWQILSLSGVVAFGLTAVVRSWPGRRFGWKSRVFLALFFSGVYAWLGWRQWSNFSYPALDAGVFHQALWHLSRGEIPASSIKNLDNLWGDHFHPILVVFSIFYRFFGFGGVLAAQGLVIGVGVVGAIALVERISGDSWLAGLCGVGYGLFFGFQEAVSFGFYPEVVVPTALVFALWAMIDNRKAAFGGAVLLALLAKENAALYVIFLGFTAILYRQAGRGVKTVIVGLGWFVFTTLWLIPKLGRGEYPYAPRFSFREAVNPLWLLRRLTFPPIKLETLSLTLVSFGLLEIFSLSSLLLALPMIAERFLPEVLNRWTTHFHYSLPLAPVLVFAAARGAVVLKNRYQEALAINVGVAAGMMVLVSAISVTVFDHRPLVGAAFQIDQGVRDDLANAVRLVPARASVAATNALVPPLADREQIYPLPTQQETDYVVIGAKTNLWPLNRKTLALLREGLARGGYEPIFQSRSGEVFVHPRRALALRGGK